MLPLWVEQCGCFPLAKLVRASAPALVGGRHLERSFFGGRGAVGPALETDNKREVGTIFHRGQGVRGRTDGLEHSRDVAWASPGRERSRQPLAPPVTRDTPPAALFERPCVEVILSVTNNRGGGIPPRGRGTSRGVNRTFGEAASSACARRARLGPERHSSPDERGNAGLALPVDDKPGLRHNIGRI